MKRLFLSIMKPGMSFYAQHAPWVETTEAEFLEDKEIKRVISLAQRFGDKVRLMEDNPDPNKPNILVRQLI